MDKEKIKNWIQTHKEGLKAVLFISIFIGFVMISSYLFFSLVDIKPIVALPNDPFGSVVVP